MFRRLTFDVSFTTKPPQDSICSRRASINIGFYILAYVIINYVHVNIFFSVYIHVGPFLSVSDTI